MTQGSENSDTSLSAAAPPLDLLARLREMQAHNLLLPNIRHWKSLLAATPPTEGIKAWLDTVSVTLNDYANRLNERSFPEEALLYYQLALLASDTHAASILTNTGSCLNALGRLEESVAVHQKALSMVPGLQAAHSNLLLSLFYRVGVTQAMLGAAHAQWDQTYGAAACAQRTHTHHDRDPERPLRVGFVSGDLGLHPVGILLVRFLENMDRRHIIAGCYITNTYRDAVNDRLHRASAFWEDVQHLDDDQFATRVQQDGIDILIDLNGHTSQHRLGVFARKAAPVQISWLGYPGSNGLGTMDYVIADRYVLPMTDQASVRARILHLPDSFICFDPSTGAPPVSPLPATVPGKILFGCFHNPVKCNEAVIGLWAEILRRLPQSRLLLKYKAFDAPSVQEKFRARFAAYGIDAERLEFQGMSPHQELFATMGRVDLALDPFPFAGGMMTCLSLWMGLPVLTMAGEHFASRQGVSFLSTIGVTDTIAHSPQDYCEKAVELAHDLRKLADLRAKLRPAMAASPLCDGAKAARGLENVLRQVWRTWCASG